MTLNSDAKFELQGKGIDMAGASHLFDSLESAILSKRKNVNEFHNNCYRVILEIVKMVSINQTEPRTSTFQKKSNQCSLGISI